ncbi:hypothetical protein [Rhabdothermincola sediminis]|uniref:hypothetical protein n=1 Tax=Rhabdothermincola sediminis TaxID=2751370 RepID=UPI001AA0A249|nr:hypothetical protein [Rhabdothermincola sediminis]
MAPPVEIEPTSPVVDDPVAGAFDRLWERLARPFEVVGTVAALVGLSPAVVAQLVGVVVATSEEAEHLLDQFPVTVRSLATSIHTNAERCIGQLRGPVLWSETMSARASSFGDPDLFVCSAPSRAYDIDENQVLVAALVEVREAAKYASESVGDRGADDPLIRAARRNGQDASRFIEHPSLQRVSRSRPRARALKRTRSGKHRKTYGPALAMLDRAMNPLGRDDVRTWCDERTRMQHYALMGLVDRLERGGRRLPDFRAERGALYAGPVQYYHPRGLGASGQLSGIVVGQLLVDVPMRLHDPDRDRAEAQLKARAGGRRSMVIMEEDDLDRAIEVAIDLARRGR